MYKYILRLFCTEPLNKDKKELFSMVFGGEFSALAASFLIDLKSCCMNYCCSAVTGLVMAMSAVTAQAALVQGSNRLSD